MFCKTCGNLLVSEKNAYGQWMKCPQGHAQPTLNREENILKLKNETPGKKVEMMDSENILAVHDNICKKCGHDKAELIEMSCSYSDEDNVYRFKCGKCGCVEQMEGKVK